MSELLNTNGVYRKWFLTGPADSEYDDFGMFTFDHCKLDLCYNEDALTQNHVKHLVVVCETGSIDEEEDETYMHWHAYVHFSKPKRMNAVKKMFNSAEWHCEIVRNDKSVIDYCNGIKDGKPKTGLAICGPSVWGGPDNQGKRHDIEKTYKDIKDGMSLATVVDRNPSVAMRHTAGLRWIHQLVHQPKRRQQTEIYWFFGSGTGTGKTTFALDLCENMQWSYFCKTPDQKQWWDGYEPGINTVIFDEFDHSDNDLDSMLRLLQPHPCQREVKGGMVAITAHRFIFCLHQHYSDCYRHTAKYGDWLRRLQEYIVQERNFDDSPYNYKDKNAGLQIDIVEEQGIADLQQFLNPPSPAFNDIFNIV